MPLSHQAWSTEEGLPDASVHQVLQARDGYLWLATEGGVARFDGSTFTIYRRENQTAFSSNDISAIAQDATGTLWFGTADGLVSLQGSTFRHVDEHDGLPSNKVVALAATQDGGLLVLTASGLARRNGGRFEAFASGSDRVVTLEAATNGAVRAITSDARVLAYTRDRFERVDGGATLPEGTQRVVIGDKGILWSYGSHAVTLTGSGMHRVLETGRDFSAARVSALFVDRQGTGWIGTSRGLFTMTSESGAALQSVDALRSDSVLCIFQDREDNLWIGTESSGLHVLRPRKFATEPASVGEGVTAVVVGSGDLDWFGTRAGGIQRIRNGIADRPVPVSALTSPVVLSMAAGPHGDVWVGTPDGLNHVEGSHVERFTSADSLPDDFVRSVLVDARSTVWAGTRRGLARLVQGRETTLAQANGLASDSIGPLLEPQHRQASSGRFEDDLWVGTSKGLSHLSEGRVENFVPPAKRSAFVITALAELATGKLLVGVQGEGLELFDGREFRRLSLQESPKQISSIVMDRHGFAWIRGSQAVYRVAVAQLERCAEDAGACSHQLEVFGTADGLPSSAAEGDGSPQIAISPSDEAWIATRKGIGLADTAHMPFNQVAPLVAIQQFTADDIAVPVQPGEAAIAPGHSRYTFSFVALSYTLPSKVRYRYKLEGFDRNWSDAGQTRVVSYTSLPSRHYCFRVQAANNDGVWSADGASVAFRITPAFYRRWWFAALIVLALAGGTLLVLHLRERVIQRRFALVLQERNRMAREIHDTLAQDFVSVSLQLDIASGFLRANKTEQALFQLQGTRLLVKEGLQAARQSIWNLRAAAEEDSLPARLAKLVERYEGSGRRSRFTVGGAYRKLPQSMEAELLRIAQETLANVERHAEAANIDVSLFYKPEQLLLTLRDDGKGFVVVDSERKEGHYGLRGLHERAAIMQAKLTITSKPGEGTSVHMSIPLQSKDFETS